jgi:hypothetical protein
LSLSFASCQGYDFQPVGFLNIQTVNQPNPIPARMLPPNIMFVVDRSGSMTDPASSSGQKCANAAGQYTGDRTTDCKWNNLLAVMEGDGGVTVLSDGGTQSNGFVQELYDALSDPNDPARLGLVSFSNQQNGQQNNDQYSCSTGEVQVHIPVPGTSTVQDILSTLDQLAPSGATPTAATIEMLLQPGKFPSVDENGNLRARFAILLTDGAPNCNGSISPTNDNCGGDRCTGYTCSSDNWDSCGCNPSSLYSDPNLCLDEDGLVQAVTDAHNAGISTFVIGFGQDTRGGSVQETLNNAADAGGYPQPGNIKYYQADDLGTLQSALQQILQRIQPTPCHYTLMSAPPQQDVLEVLVVEPGATSCESDSDCLGEEACVNGQCATPLKDDQFTLNGTQVTITDTSVCTLITNSTVAAPVQVNFRYLTQ